MARALSNSSEEQEKPTHSNYQLDMSFLIRCQRLLGCLVGSPWYAWDSASRRQSVVWIYVLFLLIASGTEVLVYHVGLIPSHFYTILTAKDIGAFRAYMIPCLLIVLGVAGGKALVNFTGSLLSLKIRRLLTHHLHQRYIQSKTMYSLLLEHEQVDNPDQRITQDIDKLTETLFMIMEKLVMAPVLVVIYTWQCWSVAGFLGPFLIYTYFILGSIISRRLIQPIVRSVFYKELEEGNFRFLHVRLRQFAESIAFSQGETEEKERANSGLNSLLALQRSIINKQLPLHLMNQSFSYFGSILSYLIVAIPVFTGAFDGADAGELSGIISKHSFVSMYLIFQFTTIIEQSDKVSALAGYVARVGELLEAIDAVDQERQFKQVSLLVNHHDEPTILFDNVTLLSPRDKLIVTDLNLQVQQGTSIVITGPNGAGKSSLLRAMAGLWACARGQIKLPKLTHGRDLIFLPQVPYLTQGSLRDQLTYPSLDSTATLTDHEVRSLLEKVKLSHLERSIASFDTPYGLEWNKMLSPGEQQRLVFARLLFWQPTFAVLDEATSAMDEATELHLYQLVRASGITMISVSHHANLMPFHQQQLVLDGHGRYQVIDI
ncbi:ATP-binding cassette sub-family D member 4-like protein [Hesseltinella vesiculosa]|uniref:ATP-binding cassette sub-family D member 4-like protein n=1 Tax=Hesseltinella vesiculosa TaxID=101127 RepID=A0A1X2GXH9_9FUNG|nr:ATP-binding cassette sub-family D member 4-like protein [Hesseltinella vesiculosa]